MSKARRHYSARFKFQVALEAVMGLKTINQLASEHQLHPTLITKWKRRLLDGGPMVFETGQQGAEPSQDALQAQLYEQIGRLKMELEWLKKKAAPFTG
jgi:putative transposase